MTSKPKPTPMEELANRIHELEAQNKKLQDAPFVQSGPAAPVDPNAAAQARIVARKNPGDDIVHLTASGNVRTIRDPSPDLRAAQATAGGIIPFPSDKKDDPKS